MRPFALDDKTSEAQTVIERYEVLRNAAFGEAVPPEARSGLALFLTRGLWGWASVATVPIMPKSSVGRRSSSSLANEQQAVIRLFAAMAMSFNQQGYHEHISESSISPSHA